MKKNLIKLLTLTAIVIIAGVLLTKKPEAEIDTPRTWWQVQSIDTMKYSRDLAGQYKGSDGLDETIRTQVRAIAETGATHVSIGTPYDPEFLPFLVKWVAAARESGLKVWFRGNWSGWEGWFGHSKITPGEHIEKTKAFIEGNPGLFENGDIFTACPECENGALGDPRRTGGKAEYVRFLLEEGEVVRTSFERIGKEVITNFNSMNLDVAKLIMDRDTTEKLGGVVTVDHYIRSPERLAFDIEEIAERSGGLVVLGEFGAPIPDIHGVMSEAEQAEWLRNALALISQSRELIGINYWVSVGGSTAIWNGDGSPKTAVSVIKSYYNPEILEGRVRSRIGIPIKGVIITLGTKTAVTDPGGNFAIPYVPSSPEKLKISAQGYQELEVELSDEKAVLDVVLTSEKPGILEKFLNIIKNIFKLAL